MQAWDPGRAQELIQERENLPGALLPMLHALQEEFGYVYEAAVPVLARALNISHWMSTEPSVSTMTSRGTFLGVTYSKICRAEALSIHGL